MLSRCFSLQKYFLVTEAFLHYLWQYRLFDMNHLRTDDGQLVEVIRSGQSNTGAGPDFFNAQIRLDGTLWAGNVEIHIYASDWQRHRHHIDPAYDSCILHVVLENDSSTIRMNGSTIPAIQLKNKFKPYLWDNYLRLIGNRGWIPCQHRLDEIDSVTWSVTYERMIYERMQMRSEQILIALKGNKDNWEECFYQQLSRNFGFQLNAMPFEMLARSLPLKCIAKERGNILNVEALFFGQSGMLKSEFTDSYPLQLKDTYQHLATKYSLKPIPFSVWKFLRLRPVNFPTIRLAQLATLLTANPTPFGIFKENTEVNFISKVLGVEASTYWNTHFVFNKSSAFKLKRLGKISVNNLLINTFVPFLFAWAKYTGDNSFAEQAISFLKTLPPEENHLISRWKETGAPVHSAVDTQALIQLKVMNCSEKKCLTCSIGNRLINILP